MFKRADPRGEYLEVERWSSSVAIDQKKRSTLREGERFLLEVLREQGS